MNTMNVSRSDSQLSTKTFLSLLLSLLVSQPLLLIDSRRGRGAYLYGPSGLDASATWIILRTTFLAPDAMTTSVNRSDDIG